jgi:hypothetical protein
MCSFRVQRLLRKTPGMIRIPVVATILIALSVPATATATAAAESGGCLNKAEQRAAIARGQAVTLGTAIRSVRGSVRGSTRGSARGRGNREVVRARLCREPGGLVYVLTLLARNGKVTQATVDATSGKVVDAR